MFKILLVIFVISIFVVNNYFGIDGVAIFTFVYFLFSIVIMLLKYVFFTNRNRRYTSYISDLWRRVFNRFYVFVILFLPVLYVISQKYNSLQPKIDAYFLCFMFLFYFGIILFVFRVILKTIILIFKKFIYTIDPRAR
jgi:hypothetical protein